MIALPAMDSTTIRKYINETQDILLRFCHSGCCQTLRTGGSAILRLIKDSYEKMKLLHLFPQIILLSAMIGNPASSAICLAPQRPFVPSDPASVVAYADLIRQDFEKYIQAIQLHIRCLDDERARAFEEAQMVNQDYGTFFKTPRSD